MEEIDTSLGLKKMNKKMKTLLHVIVAACLLTSIFLTSNFFIEFILIVLLFMTAYSNGRLDMSN